MKTSLKLMVLAISIVASAANAQRMAHQRFLSKGFDVSFGHTRTALASNIAALNGLQVTTEGGSAGFFYGNNRIISNFTLGFYYSSSSVAQTVDRFSASKAINIYPFARIKDSSIRPYLSAGVSYDIFKFAGQYLQAEKKNYSVANDAYIGKVNQFNAIGGFGFEFAPRNSDIRVYAEAKHYKVLSESATRREFASTNVGNQMIFAVGIRYGVFGR